MDYETICNCFVGVFTHYKTSEQKVFVVHFLRNDFKEFVNFLNQNVNNNEWHISFNGLAFDAQISQFIYLNQKKLLKLSVDELVIEIYKYAQETIDRSNRGEFSQYTPYNLKIKQIDLFKMNHWDNKAKMSSLKWIQYSMDWDNVEEMPHPHNQPVVSQEILDKVVLYCINDVESTKKIFIHSKEQIQLRQTLTHEYGIDLYSASEPKIAKELFLYFLEEKTGMSKSHIKNLRTPRSQIVLADCILPGIDFKTPEFQGVLDFFRTKVVTSTKDGFKHTIKYKGVKTDYGLGGIHGAAAAGLYEAKNGWTIMTSDVVSYYPNLAIKNKWAPEHLPKKEFCDQYEWFFNERVKIPKSDPRNYVYKIILNSTYGLTGDANCFLYDPKMTMQITVNGQLLLSKLYEMVTLAIPEGIPLMQNTDGLELMIPNDKIDLYLQVCAEWEKLTQLNLEHDQYSRMIIRDVNNYMAVSKNGKVKCKGAFEWEDLEKKKVAMFHKNKSFLIIPKAIYAFFVHGTKPEDFLAQNQNIFDYCGAVKAKGGWHFEERKIQQGVLVVNRLQKIVRYFISNIGDKIVKTHTDGRDIQIEAGLWQQTVVNRLDVNEPFKTYDINNAYYLEEIYKQIDQIDPISFKSTTQLTLF